MVVTCGNVLLSSSGLISSTEIRAGVQLRGLNYRREPDICEVQSVEEAGSLEAYLCVTSTGEVIANSRNALPTLGGPKDLLSMAYSTEQPNARIERLGLLNSTVANTCERLGCVSRMFDLLRPHQRSEEIVLWNPWLLSERARQASRLRRSPIVETEEYFAPMDSTWTQGAVSHSGPCLGIEVLMAAGAVGEGWPTCDVAARQFLEFHERFCGRLVRLEAFPRYGPSRVALADRQPPNFDVLEALTGLGQRRAVKIVLSQHSFTPYVGTVPIISG